MTGNASDEARQIATELRGHAEISDRPGQYEDLLRLADRVDALVAALTEPHKRIQTALALLWKQESHGFHQVPTAAVRALLTDPTTEETP